MTKNPVTTALIDVARALYGLARVVVRDAPKNTTTVLHRLTCSVEGHKPKYGQHLERVVNQSYCVTAAVCERCEQDLYYHRVLCDSPLDDVYVTELYHNEYDKAKEAVEDV